MRIARHETLVGLRFAGLHFFLRHAFKDAEVALAQAFISDDAMPGHDGNLFRGTGSARKVAGIQRGEGLLLQADAELLRLPQAALGQGAVELALHASFGVPQRFAMADQD